MCECINKTRSDTNPFNTVQVLAKSDIIASDMDSLNHETVIGITPHSQEPKMPEGGIQNEGFVSDHHERVKRAVAAVTIRDGAKRYGNGNPILNNFNMTVPKGSIYSLLGASGCGKTTVLSCVVGMKNLNSGQVLVFGSEPGTKESGVPGRRVGYMPQEYALYNSFTIAEILSYFGTLFGMKTADIKSRRDFLKNFLELPELCQKIGSLSGGQKRRVSLSVALIHTPDLLILDEPTVGVDPLLRENIWNHLVKLVSTGSTTVIITTHYIEESRKSGTVGLMREGKLLVEKSPAALLQEYNTNILEDIVLTLCKGQVTAGDDHKKWPRKNSRKLSCGPPGADYSALNGFRQSFARIAALVMKNHIVKTRNILLLIFALMIPPLQVLIMGNAIGHDVKPLNMGLVNYENHNSTRYSQQPFKNSAPDDCNCTNLSFLFLQQIPDDSFYMYEYEREDLARDAVTQGKIWGFMVFDKDFSESYISADSSRGEMTNGSVMSKIAMELDMSNLLIGITMKKTVMNAYTSFVKILFESCGINLELGEGPVDYRTPIYGSDDIDFKEYIAPNTVIGILFFFTLSASGISVVGTLERAHVAGVTTSEVLTAYFITESIILTAQTSLSFIVMRFALQIEVNGSIYLALILMFLVGLSGVALGLTISSFCNEEIEAVLICLSLFMPNIMLAGTFWPIIGMPKVLYYMAHALPCTLASEALRSIVSRGWDLTHQNVWQGFAFTIGLICLYCVITILIHRRAKRNK